MCHIPATDGENAMISGEAPAMLSIKRKATPEEMGEVDTEKEEGKEKRKKHHKGDSGKKGKR